MSDDTTELRLGDEMVERAAQAIHDHACGCDHNPWPPTANYTEMARAALVAAFDGVPLTNFGIGLALQFFDLVICVKENVGGGSLPRAGVYVSDGPDGFTALGHALEVQWGHKPVRHLRRVNVGQIDAPTAPSLEKDRPDA